MTHLLTALLALATGWCWGHLTARIHVVVVGATAAQDDAALSADEHARFQQITGYFDEPDDPRGNAA